MGHSGRLAIGTQSRLVSCPGIYLTIRGDLAMKNSIARAMSALIVGLFLATASVTAAHATPIQDDLIARTNVERSLVGLAPLGRDATLDAVAQEWAQVMSATGRFEHSTDAWRAARIPAGWVTHGENIAYGYSSTSSVMNAWMQSAGHRANILRSSFTRIGVGYVESGNYWVQIFAGYPGPVAVPGQDQITQLYVSTGGASGILGGATSGFISISQNGGGVAQAFQNGSIYWSPSSGAFAVSGSVRDTYFSHSGAAGILGFPNSGMASIAANGGGSGQSFAGGSIYAKASRGTFAVSARVRDLYFSLGGAGGSLGWPIGAETCASTGCSQSFEGGIVYRGVTGPAWVGSPAIEAAYASLGGVSGSFGTRTSGVIPIPQNGGGVGQAYTGGSIYFKSNVGAFGVSGAVLSFYFSLGGAGGSLGWPSGAESCSSSTCSQKFEGGTVYRGTTGSARLGSPAIEAAYASLGGASGSFGARMSGIIPIPQNGGGLGQAFAGGSIYVKSGGGAFGVSGSFLSLYFSFGGAAGALGWPMSSETCTSAGCSQAFERGTMYRGATGAARIGAPAIEAAYASLGGASGIFGSRMSNLIPIWQNGGGQGQVYAGGSIYLKPGVGAFGVSGPILGFYFSLGGAAGSLGWPTSGETCTTSSCSQAFEGGTVDSVPGVGVRRR